MNIYVGNLPYEYTEDQLKAKFEQFGTVASASIIRDKVSGRSKGFGFVEIPDNNQAQTAIQALANWDEGGRKVKVSEARPKQEGSFRRGGGFNRRERF